MLRKTILLITLIATHLSLAHSTAEEKNRVDNIKIDTRKGLTVVPSSYILHTTQINEEE